MQPRPTGDADARRATLCRQLRRALPMEFGGVPLEPLPDKGLAHDHVRLTGTGWLARVPKQSQMGLAPDANLAYQTACFERAARGGHAPRLHGVVAPAEGLPRGALIVEEIVGRSTQLPQDLPAIAQALASFHTLPLPAPAARPPLRDPADPLADLLEEVQEQAAHLGAARLERDAARMVSEELALFERAAQGAERPPKALISFDAHPGNFIVRGDGRAVLVDLEKARYSFPPLDLAHATLYTSTTWDVDSSAELDPADVFDFYGHWAAAAGPSAQAWLAWQADLRRGMWLWALTWCAKWRVLSAQALREDQHGEDWSAQRSDAALIEHVRGRVDCYLHPRIVQRVRDELHALARELAAA